MASGPKEGSLPSHAVPSAVMQMMSKVKVKPKTSEVPLKAGRGSERGAHSAVPPPEASFREFDIKLDMTGKSGLGLDVDWADGKTLFIKSVKPDGAIKDHNATCSKSEMVQGGDRVISINDRSGDAKAMLAEVRAKSLHLVIRTSRDPPARPSSAKAVAEDASDGADAEARGTAPRHREYTVTLDLAGKSGLGLDVDWSDGKTLYIKSVKADGAVSEWNRSCALDDVVQGGDRVTAINGKAGDPKAMLAECKKKAHLQLTVLREPPPGRTQAPPALQDKRAPAPAEARADAGASQPPGRPQQRAARPHEFVVSLDMSKHPALGLDVDWADGKTLYINSVQPGAIQEWNSEHPLHQQVSAGDRIVAVNGYADDPEAMASLCKELCTTQCRFQLLVRGPPPPPSAAASPPDPQGTKEKEKEKKEKKGKGRDDTSGEDQKEGKSKRGRRDRDESGDEGDDKERRDRREREEKKARRGREKRSSS